MRSLFSCLVLVAIAAFATAQDKPTKPVVSQESLTSEEVSIYRTVLKDYLKGSENTLNVAAMTEPLDESDDCVKLVRLTNPSAPTSVVHRLEPSISGAKITLVDPERQRNAVEENDPQNLMKKAIDEHEKVTDEQLDQSVKQAFHTGVFTLSEIAFDKEHRRAVVSYSFVCGMLCGHGNTMVLKRSGESWKIAKRCGGWIS
jgi:hypothetical protein